MQKAFTAQRPTRIAICANGRARVECPRSGELVHMFPICLLSACVNICRYLVAGRLGRDSSGLGGLAR